MNTILVSLGDGPLKWSKIPETRENNSNESNINNINSNNIIQRNERIYRKSIEGIGNYSLKQLKKIKTIIIQLRGTCSNSIETSSYSSLDNTSGVYFNEFHYIWMASNEKAKLDQIDKELLNARSEQEKSEIDRKQKFQKTDLFDEFSLAETSKSENLIDLNTSENVKFLDYFKGGPNHANSSLRCIFDSKVINREKIYDWKLLFHGNVLFKGTQKLNVSAKSVVESKIYGLNNGTHNNDNDLNVIEKDTINSLNDTILSEQKNKDKEIDDVSLDTPNNNENVKKDKIFVFDMMKSLGWSFLNGFEKRGFLFTLNVSNILINIKLFTIRPLSNNENSILFKDVPWFIQVSSIVNTNQLEETQRIYISLKSKLSPVGIDLTK